MVPPGWKSAGGAVVGVAVTLPMPVLIWVTPLRGAAVTLVFLAAVTVEFLAVVVVLAPGAAVVSVVLAVVSFVTSEVLVVACSVVVGPAVFFPLPPPQAAATKPTDKTTINARPCLSAECLACAPLIDPPLCCAGTGFIRLNGPRGSSREDTPTRSCTPIRGCNVCDVGDLGGFVVISPLLTGAVDFYVHASPDPIPRRCHDVALAEELQAAGVAAAVHRHHSASTV